MRVQTIIVALSLTFATQAASAQPASGGPVDPAVISHSPAVIPFGVTQVPMRPVMHTGSFLYVGVPVWEIREAGGAIDMLVRNGTLGKSLPKHSATSR